MSSTVAKDNILSKLFHLLRGFARTLFALVKAVASFLSGCLLVLVSSQVLTNIFRNWTWSAALVTTVYIILFVVIFIIGSILILIPFRKLGLVAKILQILLMPLAGLSKLGNYYIGLVLIYFELVILGVICSIAFSALRYIQPLRTLNDRAVYYLAFTLTVLVFTFLGQKFTNAIMGKGGKQEEFFWIINLTQPSILRFVVFSIAALLYIIANIETFSGWVIFPWVQWATLKDVIVQVFLTYVAVDGALVAWRDHKEFIKTTLLKV